MEYSPLTRRARKVMQLANREATRLNHEQVDPEHVLLGMIVDGDGIAITALKNLGVELRKICRELERLMPSHPALDKGPHCALFRSPRAVTLLEHAREEAEQLGHGYVGSEHFLLGMLREPEGIAARLLAACGVTLENVRSELMRMLVPMVPTDAPQAHRSEFLDLPPALSGAAAELDGKIECLNLQKTEATAAEAFEQAALLRDQVQQLTERKRSLLRDWCAKRPIDASWLSWNDGAVVTLARRIQTHRYWSELPLLANTLQEAGCGDLEILDHCREAGEHTDHCWVLDVLLAR